MFKDFYIENKTKESVRRENGSCFINCVVWE